MSTLYSECVALYGQWVGSLDPQLAYFSAVFVWAALTATYVVVGSAFLFVDVFRVPDVLYRRKVQLDAPFLVEGSSKNPSLARTLLVLSLAHAVSLATFLGMQRFAMQWQLGSFAHSPIPPWSTLIAQGISWVLLAETGFYFSHRLMHAVPLLYQTVHKVHHQFRAPIAISAMYAHPVEIVVGNIGAHLLWPFLFGMHPVIIALGAAGGMTQSMLDHCGYWYSFSRKAFQPFFHDAHHQFFTVDFGFLGMWDRLLHTSGKWRAMRAEVVKRNGLKKAA